GTGTGGSGTWNFAGSGNAVDFLAAGQSITETYVVEGDDNHGGKTTPNVLVTLNGTNQNPGITTGAPNGTTTPPATTTGSNTPDTANGAVTFTDADLSDTHTATVTSVTTSGVTSGLPNNATLLSWLSLGTLTDTTGTGIGGSDAWTFSAADQNFDYLAAG